MTLALVACLPASSCRQNSLMSENLQKSFCNEVSKLFSRSLLPTRPAVLPCPSPCCAC